MILKFTSFLYKQNAPINILSQMSNCEINRYKIYKYKLDSDFYFASISLTLWSQIDNRPQLSVKKLHLSNVQSADKSQIDIFNQNLVLLVRMKMNNRLFNVQLFLLPPPYKFSFNA